MRPRLTREELLALLARLRTVFERRLREAVLEQVGKDQTDRLRDALSDAVKALSS